MSRSFPTSLSPASNVFGAWPSKFRFLLWSGFLLVYLLVGARGWLPPPLLHQRDLLYTLLLVLAAATALFEQARVLPVQSVLLAAGVIAVLSGLMQVLGAIIETAWGGRPVQPMNQASRLLPYLTALRWIVMVLAS